MWVTETESQSHFPVTNNPVLSQSTSYDADWLSQSLTQSVTRHCSSSTTTSGTVTSVSVID